MQSVIRRLAALILCLVLLPVFGIIAGLVWLDSPGPIIFRQTRIGKGQQPFVIYKFRTMYDRIWEVEDKGPNDPRVTPLGKWLRKSHLDELSQLWNIVRGEMTFVGPRPMSMELVQKYSTRHRRYQRRFDLLPGITGYAQIKLPKVNFGEGRQAVVYDEFYRIHKNFQLDVIITLRTLFTMACFRSH